MIEVLKAGLKGNVIALRAREKVTHEDYVRTVVPLVEEKIASFGRVRLFYHLGDDVAGFTAAAMWDDARVGFRHLAAFEKIAVVTDIGWVREAAGLFGFFLPCPVQIFRNDQVASAVDWINQ